MKFVLPASLAALAASALVCTPSFALEALKTYDGFPAAPINPALWNDWERTRAIKNGVLNLVERNYGGTASNVGTVPYNWNENLSNPAAVTELRAKIVVNALEANTCAGNASPGFMRARVIGAFYNIGTPVAGSSAGDAQAQVRIGRQSNSTDAAGVLRVQGLLANCVSADCSSVAVVGSIVDLGTATIGQAVIAEVQWDKATKTFIFTRDNGAVTGTVVYTDSDASAPSIPFKELSTRTEMPNCTAGRVSGSIDASFDNVSVNKSAAP